MAESIERYFRLMPLGRRVRPAARVWCPAADVYRTRDGWIVKVDLAGVSADDLEITVEGPILHIAGCRRDTFYGEGITYHQLEITYSRFEKTLRFPCSIEGAHLARDYRDGLLILHLQAEEECEEEKTNDECGMRNDE
jgi:HSP20 family protein